MKGRQTWTPQEKNSAGTEEELCSQTDVFYREQRYAIALKYTDLRTSTV
jgi:hypothetical protein